MWMLHGGKNLDWRRQGYAVPSEEMEPLICLVLEMLTSVIASRSAGVSRDHVLILPMNATIPTPVATARYGIQPLVAVTLRVNTSTE